MACELESPACYFMVEDEGTISIITNAEYSTHSVPWSGNRMKIADLVASLTRPHGSRVDNFFAQQIERERGYRPGCWPVP